MSEIDPELREWLAAARQADEGPAPDLGPLYSDVEAQITDAEKKGTFWLRTRSTAARRAIAGLVAVTWIGIAGVLLMKRALDAGTALAVVGLAVLLGLSVHHALRPLHRPPIARWARALIVLLTLGATLVIALFPPGGAVEDDLSVSPCLFYGLLVGLPVYMVLRLLDRGTSAAPLLGACAAGLTGNLALALHCPSDDPEHLMFGHFSVALLFVAGLGVLHFVLRPRRR